ncbi:hypothetical protein CBM2615_B150103 [Cupriavidus taiwanensis]|uniref:Uncharacterized protein n=1 Tax=Cupriavidus taiwanensis TaxID=164546 RepID=A0A375E6X4_9BURK|nr:hypothetical protein CBM2614_B160106 [Cupriavidus taiwanensis]SOZ65124.1 hypothetical protein CBM2615_B150103 [Cupriavidus taiwanensis]SOZ68797.1 hypothetical protein CBM2613_B120103 [Cupriavidus taiwanensis]SPA08223.1 hypothetical protein CBM2625_B120102 [Cupriavidus taiwanensis]
MTRSRALFRLPVDEIRRHHGPPCFTGAQESQQGPECAAGVSDVRRGRSCACLALQEERGGVVCRCRPCRGLPAVPVPHLDPGRSGATALLYPFAAFPGAAMTPFSTSPTPLSNGSCNADYDARHAFPSEPGDGRVGSEARRSTKHWMVAVCLAALLGAGMWFEHRLLGASLPFNVLPSGYASAAPSFAGRECRRDCEELFQGYEWAHLRDLRRDIDCYRYTGAYLRGCLYRIRERAVARRR